MTVVAADVAAGGVAVVAAVVAGPGGPGPLLVFLHDPATDRYRLAAEGGTALFAGRRFDVKRGELACLEDCSDFDLSGCAERCGDATINGPEVCEVARTFRRKRARLPR